MYIAISPADDGLRCRQGKPASSQAPNHDNESTMS